LRKPKTENLEKGPENKELAFFRPANVFSQIEGQVELGSFLNLRPQKVFLADFQGHSGIPT